jgi:hypothetical protein
MSDDQILGERVQALLLDLCAVLHSYGYEEISVGALMRMVGVPNDRASNHDDQVLKITQEILATNHAKPGLDRPSGTTLH